MTLVRFALGAIVSEEKNVQKKFFLPLFPLNRYNSRERRELCNDPGLVALRATVPEKKIRARRALSIEHGPVAEGVTWSKKKIVKEKFLFPLFPLNRYNSDPIG
ncbi:hypothetical protein V1477_006253 [Vespula maculifrons]|uniref:Uncharacterized protein n=1 Tax=Vespula maculifrons TaxID=7453 RepID=A0ABD2CMI1_VESMC